MEDAYVDDRIGPQDGDELTEMRRWALAIHASLEQVRKQTWVIASDTTSGLFAILVRNHQDPGRAGRQILTLLQNHHAGRAVRAILHDPSRNWTLDELAFQAHTSRATLVRIFRRSLQLAPLMFVTELRLELACRKLSATHLTIAQIAAEIGYQSESAFSRAFRRRFGLPPRQAARRCIARSGLELHQAAQAARQQVMCENP
jgi:AraC family transcriptional activator of mtrCDE